MSNKTLIKIKCVKNGKHTATVDGTAIEVVEALAQLFLESEELFRFIKASVEITQLHLNKTKNNE